jgi:pentatricopeptide repeat domain-containing protein 1
MFGEIKQPGIDPDVVTYNTLIDIYAIQGDMEKWKQMFGEIKQPGINPDVVTSNTLIDIYAIQGDMEKLQQMFGEIDAELAYIIVYGH